MKKKRKLFSTGNIIAVLVVLCLVLAALLVLVAPTLWYAVAAGAIALVAILLVVLCARGVRRSVIRAMGGKKVQEVAKREGVYNLSLPVAVLDAETRILWYNTAFRVAFAKGEELGMLPVGKALPGVTIKPSALTLGQPVTYLEKQYTLYGSTTEPEPFQLLFFVEDTLLKEHAAEYEASRPSVLYFMIDTYDDIIKELRESEGARIMSEIDFALEQYIAKYNGLLRKVSSARYIAVVEERGMQAMLQTRFDILDAVRNMGSERVPVSLSVGVGRLGADFKECEDKARQALDMCLGRGGDQAAVNGPEGYEFFGGLSRSVEKRTKVKSRIVASAIKELTGEYRRVLVMGHKNSDMDSVGAAVGMLRFAKMCNKPASIVINQRTSLATSLLQYIQKNCEEEMFISPERAEEIADEDTLLIVVDTHLKHMIESREVYEACGATVVVDHHRKQVGHIDDALIFYHEPYASSASELVSEMLQYATDKNNKPTPLEADALLAGILLDTRTFSLHVGVRTFEASAYLRRLGAQTAKVKSLFTTSMDEYMYRSHLVSEAKVHRGCAVVVSDQIPEDCEVVSPQAANDLLTISGVQASFVAIKQGDVVRISARSMGEINVQLIMEKLGGGGHLTMAGAQLKGDSVEAAQKKIMAAIEEYLVENPESGRA